MLTKSKKMATASSKPQGITVCSALTALALVALFTASSASQAYAQERRGPNPMDGVADALNLKPEQLHECLGEPPAPPGPRPLDAPEARPSDSDRAALISCLQGKNSALTADQIDAAMHAMHDPRPPRPKS
ncbi:hypothetical protein [Pacificibacter sp. AS14]|uniref:hypothetical protein n=1 Tax=Pacificibacter sp. AS14 TaxID=3135785 RepID=UPI0031702DD1